MTFSLSQELLLKRRLWKTSSPRQKANWIFFVNGSLISEGSEAVIIMIGSDFEKLEYSLLFEVSTTNNNVEYEAVMTGLDLEKLRVLSVEIYSNSQLIVGHMMRKFEKLEYSLYFKVSTTNNNAEYEVVMTVLDLEKLGVSSVKICSDSQLIVR